MAARFTTKYRPTYFFTKKLETSFDNTTSKVVERIGVFAYDSLRLGGQFTQQPSADVEVIVHLELKDYFHPDDGNHYDPLTVILGAATLCTFPIHASAEDTFEIEYRYKNKTLEQFRYRYGRTQSMSWLAIPFNILVSSWHPGYGTVPNEIEMDRVLIGLRNRIQRDAIVMRARMQALPKEQ